MREKRARKRRASDEDSEVRVLRRESTVGSTSAETVVGSVADGAMIDVFLFLLQKVMANWGGGKRWSLRCNGKMFPPEDAENGELSARSCEAMFY